MYLMDELYATGAWTRRSGECLMDGVSSKIAPAFSIFPPSLAVMSRVQGQESEAMFVDVFP